MDDEDIGYRKPPKSTQFKKGRSGNPYGRPRSGTKNINNIIARELERKIKVTEEDETVFYSAIDIAVRQLVQKAAKGDLKAQKMLFPLIEKMNAKDEIPQIPQMRIFRECRHANCPSHKENSQKAT